MYFIITITVEPFYGTTTKGSGLSPLIKSIHLLVVNGILNGSETVHSRFHKNFTHHMFGSVDVRHEVAYLIVNQRVDLL